ncbi:MAG: hypothetical protein IKT33_03115 [Clostridia bacterium]|nr:hypothetical protein [Clostridia bacterium]
MVLIFLFGFFFFGLALVIVFIANALVIAAVPFTSTRYQNPQEYCNSHNNRNNWHNNIFRNNDCSC